MKTNIVLKPIFVDIDGVIGLTGLSKTTICDLIKTDFPKPRKASKRGARWLVREIEAWCESRPYSDILPPPNTGKNAEA
jgi:prophage regulatory protein